MKKEDEHERQMSFCLFVFFSKGMSTVRSQTMRKREKKGKHWEEYEEEEGDIAWFCQLLKEWLG